MTNFFLIHNTSAKWAINSVDNLFYLKWQEMVNHMWAVRDPFDQRFFDERDAIDKMAMELYKKDPGAVHNFLTDYPVPT
ncbi:MAG: hypothetical protein WD577_09140 [Bacteroidales bacterium]